MRTLELLSPAGSFDSMRAAINAGCDAVYIGGQAFGARAFANNLDTEKMIEAIDYVHTYGKSIYITVNTLIKNKELEEKLYDYIYPFYVAGVDAVIVQDMGAIKFINENFIDLPIHASTQMTLTTSLSANFLKDYGVTRIVTPRELSINEISRIRKETDLEIETFIHGALCYCYSGQCLLSSMIGGRSGNRGRCAQPCRKSYMVNEQKAKSYVLSPKDMCTVEILPELINSGIDSFKIEGRMKKPEYTAAVTSVYRKYIDLFFDLGEEDYRKYIINNEMQFHNDIILLQDLYNRGGFTKAFFNVHNEKSIMSMQRPNHFGTFVGTVKDVKGNQCRIKLEEDINSQDVLEIRDIYEYTVKEGAKKDDDISAKFNKGLKVKPGQKVYRMRNQSTIEKINKNFIETNSKINIEASFSAKYNKNMEFCLKYNNITVNVNGDICQKAQKSAATVDRIKKQLSKLGNTKYVYKRFDIDIEDNLFIAVSSLNELRRRAIELLEEKIKEQYKRNNINRIANKPKPINKIQNVDFSVSVCTIEQLEVVLQYKYILNIFIDMDNLDYVDIKEKIDRTDKNIYFILPHILRYDYFNKGILANKEYFSGIKGVVIRNIEEFMIISEFNNNLNVILDYNLYTVNNSSKGVWQKSNVYGYSVSEELNKSELAELADNKSYINVYGKTRVMVSAGCIKKNTSQCNHISDMTVLTDDYKSKFIVKNICRYCYNVMYDSRTVNLAAYYNEIIKMGYSHLRIDFIDEDKISVKDVLDNYDKLYNNGNIDKAFEKYGILGHYIKGVD